MIIGIGLDIIEVDRIRSAVVKWEDKFERRVFTENEIRYCEEKGDKFQSLACRFAAKEAFFKALGTGWRLGMKWTEIEVVNDEFGKPYILLSGKVNEYCEQLGLKKIFISLTSTKDYGAAQVILEG